MPKTYNSKQNQRKIKIKIPKEKMGEVGAAKKHDIQTQQF